MKIRIRVPFWEEPSFWLQLSLKVWGHVILIRWCGNAVMRLYGDTVMPCKSWKIPNLKFHISILLPFYFKLFICFPDSWFLVPVFSLSQISHLISHISILIFLIPVFQLFKFHLGISKLFMIYNIFVDIQKIKTYLKP